MKEKARILLSGKKGIWLFTVLCAWVFVPIRLPAQSYLDKTVNVKARQKPVSEVLDIIGRQGGFYFSYNTNLVPADSLVDVDIWNKTVKQSLDLLFKNRYEYKQAASHIIIQSPSAGQYWYVSGYITDSITGQRIRDVSVFESSQLVASLTNDQGYFRLKLKDKTYATSIYVRNSLYRDTAIVISPGVDQEIKLSILPKENELQPVVISGSDRVEGTWLGKALLSSRQRIQSLNLDKFFVNVPVQGSLIPGLSTQGKMTSQVVNHFSFNMLGGYTAGTKGLEAGGLFNINKKDAGYLQAAGVFNLVGGSVTGLQAAGVHNHVLHDVSGLQAAGVTNIARGSITGGQASGVAGIAFGDMTGMQAAGVFNMAADTFTGLQVSGAVNLASKQLRGVQLSGCANISLAASTGVQVSGAVNYARRLRGAQVGIVNIADTLDGVGIGMFSFVKHGYHKLSCYTDESMPYHISLKSGTRWLYNIYDAGIQPSAGNRAFHLSTGYGSELPATGWLSINPELLGGVVYLGNWAQVNPIIRMRLNFNFRVHKYFALYAGPSYVAYWDNKQPQVSGYAVEILSAAYKRNNYNSNLSSWLGWNAGVTIF